VYEEGIVLKNYRMMDLNSMMSSASKITENVEITKNNNSLDFRKNVFISKSKENGILNNSCIHKRSVGDNVFERENSQLKNADSKFSPRVKQGIELKILKPGSTGIYSDVKSVTQNYLRSRVSTPSPLSTPPMTDHDSDTSSSTLESLKSGNTTSDSGKSTLVKKKASIPISKSYLVYIICVLIKNNYKDTGKDSIGR
jgi:hypothetical protein